MNSALDGTHSPSQTPFPVWLYLFLEAGFTFVNIGIVSY
ncbi:unnamed protein product [Laminaria digitata]